MPMTRTRAERRTGRRMRVAFISRAAYRDAIADEAAEAEADYRRAVAALLDDARRCGDVGERP